MRRSDSGVFSLSDHRVCVRGCDVCWDAGMGYTKHHIMHHALRNITTTYMYTCRHSHGCITRHVITVDVVVHVDCVIRVCVCVC